MAKDPGFYTLSANGITYVWASSILLAFLSTTARFPGF
jgi:hypothetical protein